MTRHQDVVRAYFDGFRRRDHEQILACLIEDVTWYLVGQTTLQGKAAFDGEIENDNFVGQPELEVDRLVEADDTVVAIGTGRTQHREQGTFDFAFCDVFTFAGALVRVVESYVVPLSAAPSDASVSSE